MNKSEGIPSNYTGKKKRLSLKVSFSYDYFDHIEIGMLRIVEVMVGGDGLLRQSTNGVDKYIKPLLCPGKDGGMN